MITSYTGEPSLIVIKDKEACQIVRRSWQIPSFRRKESHGSLRGINILPDNGVNYIRNRELSPRHAKESGSDLGRSLHNSLRLRFDEKRNERNASSISPRIGGQAH